MAEQILVPMDGSPQSRQALEHAIGEYPNGAITVLHVIDPIEAGYAADPMGMDYWEDWFESAERRADRLFEEVESIADEHGATVQTDREVGPPSRAIVRYADEGGFDHIVMGSHGRSGVSRILLGSVAETVVRRAAVPVTVVR